MSEEESPPVTAKDMEAFIHGLGPDSELFAGRQFFRLLFEKRGLKGVLDFIDRSVKALDEQSELDPFYDFTPIERELLHKAPVKLWSRRGMLSLMPCVYFAAAEGAVGVTGLAAQVAQPLSRRLHEDLKTVSEDLDETFGPTATVAICVAVADEAWELRHKWKLDEVKDAVVQLNRGLPEDQQFRPIASNGAVMDRFKQLADTVERLRVVLQERDAQKSKDGAAER